MMHAVTTKLDVTSSTPFDYHNKLYSLLGANKVERLCFDVENPNAHFIFEHDNYAESFYRKRKNLEMKDRKMYVYWLGDKDPVNKKLYFDGRRKQFGSFQSNFEKWNKRLNSLPGVTKVTPKKLSSNHAKFESTIIGCDLEFSSAEAADQVFYNQMNTYYYFPGEFLQTNHRGKKREKLTWLYT